MSVQARTVLCGFCLVQAALGLTAQTPQVIKLAPANQEMPAVPKADIVPDTAGCTVPAAQRLTTEVRLHLDAKGQVEDASLGHSSGDPCLDKAALAAVRGSEFYPAEKHGRAVGGKSVLLIDFGGETVDQVTRPPGPVTAPRVLRQTMLSFGDCRVQRDSEYHAAVEVVIDVHGVPARASLVKTTGDPCLDLEAVRGARGYLFQPATQNGVPVPVKLRIEMQFNN